MNDQSYMQLALDLARNGKGLTSPNPCVGAVVVKNGTVVGKGWHHGPGLAHAEVNALDDAGEKARGGTLYVTLEPCNHFGKTPPCTRRILEAGIREVVVGCTDPNPGVAGGGNQWLEEQGVTVRCGILAAECRELIEAFAWFVRHNGLPFVILKAALTLDGRLATRTGDSKWITGAAARRQVHQIRHEVDGILVGAGTVHADDPSLTARREDKASKDPVRIILDTALGISPKARVLNLESDAPTILVAGPDADSSGIERLAGPGVQVIQTGLKNGRLDFTEVMIKLGQFGIQSLLIEGGARVFHSALHAGVVNKVMCFTAPRILGGDDGIPMCSGKGPALMADAFSMERVTMERFDDDMLVQGYLK